MNNVHKYIYFMNIYILFAKSTINTVPKQTQQ